MGIILSPTSLNRCSIAFGEVAVVGKGITIYPGTDTPELTRETIGSSIGQEINAIFETTGETLAFLEVIG